MVCPPLQLPNNGRVSYNDYLLNRGEYFVFKEATYQCNDGYSIEHGWRVRTCQSSREWSGYPAVCPKSKENKQITYGFLMKMFYPNVIHTSLRDMLKV